MHNTQNREQKIMKYDGFIQTGLTSLSVEHMM